MSTVHTYQITCAYDNNFTSNEVNQKIYNILQDLEHKLGVVGTLVVSDAICMYTGKYPTNNEPVKQMQLSFNPLRTTQEQELEFVETFTKLLKLEFKQNFIPNYKTSSNLINP